MGREISITSEDIKSVCNGGTTICILSGITTEL